MTNYIIGLKNKSYFYACNGGTAVTFLCTDPEDAARTNDIGMAKKLIKSILKGKKKLVDLNGEWEQGDDFKKVTEITGLNMTKNDFVVFEFSYVVKEI